MSMIARIRRFLREHAERRAREPYVEDIVERLSSLFIGPRRDRVANLSALRLALAAMRYHLPSDPIMPAVLALSGTVDADDALGRFSEVQFGDAMATMSHLVMFRGEEYLDVNLAVRRLRHIGFIGVDGVQARSVA